MTKPPTTFKSIERDCWIMAQAEMKRCFDRVIAKPMPDALAALADQAKKYQECWIDAAYAEREVK